MPIKAKPTIQFKKKITPCVSILVDSNKKKIRKILMCVHLINITDTPILTIVHGKRFYLFLIFKGFPIQARVKIFFLIQFCTKILLKHTQRD